MLTWCELSGLSARPVLRRDQCGWPANSNVMVRDLWAQSNLGVKQSYTALVKPHDVSFVRLTLQQEQEQLRMAVL
jgi:hypothetical protein